VRQLWDWKLSPNIDLMPPEVLAIYAQMCGWTLARAHARSGDRVAISSYIGSNDTFPQAVARFATAYADQNDIDHEALAKAIADGEVRAEAGV
jgi:predicted alpha/beta hydrolase